MHAPAGSSLPKGTPGGNRVAYSNLGPILIPHLVPYSMVSIAFVLVPLDTEKQEKSLRKMPCAYGGYCAGSLYSTPRLLQHWTTGSKKKKKKNGYGQKRGHHDPTTVCIYFPDIQGSMGEREPRMCSEATVCVCV